jgi:hypothetical protein
VVTPDQLTAGNDDLAAFVTFVRHELLQTAVGEMRHLCWANELLWTLQKNAIIPEDFALPALGVTEAVPLDVPETGPNAGKRIQIGRYLWSLSPESSTSLHGAKVRVAESKDFTPQSFPHSDYTPLGIRPGCSKWPSGSPPTASTTSRRSGRSRSSSRIRHC